MSHAHKRAGTGADRCARNWSIRSRNGLAGARNKAALVLFGRSVVATMAAISGWLGFLARGHLQSANADPYAFATGVIAFMLMRQRAHAEQVRGVGDAH